MTDRELAIQAYKNRKTIIIETNADFTPKGKRTAKIVKHALSGKKIKPIIRMYVAGRTYMEKDLNEYELVNEWLKA